MPEAALFDILLFLPVVSLLRFKSVCKTWCSMIESSSFVTRHLYHNREKNNVVCAREGGELYMFSGNRQEMMGSKLNVESLSWEHGKKDFRMEMVNSCDGIVCLAHAMGRDVRLVSLWNPATKQVRQLPEPTYFRPLARKRQHVFALGFDRKTKDYKIVRVILEHFPYLLFELHRNSVVEVYSKRSNAWRTIHNGKDFPITWIEDYRTAACNNEICVWIGSAPSSRGYNARSLLGNRSFFYFDLGNEVYGIVPAPKTLLNPPGDDSVLAFVGEKFCLVKCYSSPDTSEYSLVSDCTPSPFVYEIWVMDEFGKKESWNKVYRVEQPLQLLKCTDMISSLSNNGQFIVKAMVDKSSHERRLYLLDLVTLQEFLLLALVVDDKDLSRRWEVINYTESLVCVNGID